MSAQVTTCVKCGGPSTLGKVCGGCISLSLEASIAMQSGLQACDPVLLEPILSVEISVPTEFTSNVLRLISGRRGQILGYDAKANWTSWDVVSAYLPQAEMQDLIIELRSLTQGVGFFNANYDHLQEVVGREADRLLVK